MKRLILLTYLFLQSLCCLAQTDTSFWFAYPYYTLHRPTTADHAFYTFDQAADIHCEFFDMNTATGAVISDLSFNQNLPPNWDFKTGTSVYMRDDTCYRTTGIHATTSVPVSSVFISRDYYTLKGNNALGTHFLVPAPKNRTSPSDDNHIRSLRTCIEIIATEDHTQVHIDPAADLLCGTPAHTPLNITLQRGQTYYAPAASTDPQQQLGGSIVTSNHPIAVNITADSVASNDNNHYSVIGEQLVPTRLLSNRYEIQHRGHENMQVTFYPLYDNTSCLHFGDYSTSFVLNRGQDTTAFTPSTIAYYEFDKPVAAFATVYSQGYFAGTELPRKDCSGSSQVVLIYDSLCTESWYGIFVDDSAKNLFTFSSGNAVPYIFPGNDWNDPTRVVGFLVWNFGFERLHNPVPFQLAELHNNLDTLSGCTFTIPTDYAPKGHLYFNMDQHHYCLGDTVFFKFERDHIKHFLLTGPNGFSNTEADSLYLIADTASTGWYHLIRTDSAACAIHDSIFITIHVPLYDELFDTINESQLPYERFGTTFLGDIDTLIVRSSGLSNCDTTIQYHLRIVYNIHDTIDHYICNNQLPYITDSLTFFGSGCRTFARQGSYGQDSMVTICVHVIPNTDTTICDSISEDLLPWTAFDTVFTDTVANLDILLTNEAGCDSVIHYSLFIFWNGDHCDTTLEYPTFVTPNGDGVNDRFIIKGLITNNCFKYNELTIYDRYGKQVYHHRNIASDDDWWDPAAQRAPVGTYFYYFKAHGVHIWTQHTGVIEVLYDK